MFEPEPAPQSLLGQTLLKNTNESLGQVSGSQEFICQQYTYRNTC